MIEFRSNFLLDIEFPDLTRSPFSLRSKSFGHCLKVVSVGTESNLIPKVNNDKIYDLKVRYFHYTRIRSRRGIPDNSRKMRLRRQQSLHVWSRVCFWRRSRHPWIGDYGCGCRGRRHTGRKFHRSSFGNEKVLKGASKSCFLEQWNSWTQHSHTTGVCDNGGSGSFSGKPRICSKSALHTSAKTNGDHELHRCYPALLWGPFWKSTNKFGWSIYNSRWNC